MLKPTNLAVCYWHFFILFYESFIRMHKKHVLPFLVKYLCACFYPTLEHVKIFFFLDSCICTEVVIGIYVELFLFSEENILADN